jgi:hypothetical protein
MQEINARMTNSETVKARKSFNKSEKLFEELADIVGRQNKKQLYDLTVFCRKIYVKGAEQGFDLCAERLVNILCKMHGQD